MKLVTIAELHLSTGNQHGKPYNSIDNIIAQLIRLLYYIRLQKSIASDLIFYQ